MWLSVDHCVRVRVRVRSSWAVSYILYMGLVAWNKTMEWNGIVSFCLTHYRSFQSLGHYPSRIGSTTKFNVLFHNSKPYNYKVSWKLPDNFSCNSVYGRTDDEGDYFTSLADIIIIFSLLLKLTTRIAVKTRCFINQYFLYTFIGRLD